MNGSRPTTADAGTPAATILSREDALAIAKKALSFADPSADTVVSVAMNNAQNTRFSRNEITTQLDAALGQVTVLSMIGNRSASAVTQRFDDEGLREAVEWAEQAASGGPGASGRVRLIQPRDYPVPPGLWSEATRAVDIEGRIGHAVKAVGRAEGFVTAGTVDLSASSLLVSNSDGLVAYCRSTSASMNMTARTADNTGSGWAGKYSRDASRLDAGAVAATATDKAVRSQGPSAVEPGRYTIILEPDAYAQMIFYMMRYHMDLEGAEDGFNVWAAPGGGTKIGQQVFDERVSFVSDPMDADYPYCPFNGSGVPFDRTYWVRDGVLENLSFGDGVAEQRGREYPLANPIAVRLQPREGMPLMTLDEMVETCERGIYVSRLTTLFADFRRLVFTGVTRDGTWLVERGRITRPIANMRYVDSHMYFLNSIEALGEPMLTSGGNFVLPPVRSRDFNFTAIADAV